MKAFIIVLIFACAYAKPGFVSTYNNAGLGFPAAYNPLTYGLSTYAAYQPVNYATPAVAPVTYNAAVGAVGVPAFTKTQYHAQDVLGQASYGYSYPGQTHNVVRDAAGNERGSYAYINPDGNEIQVSYVADQGGFRAVSNALPQAHVAIAPSVVAAAPVAVAGAPIAVIPTPVAETPEVIEARRAHAAAHVEARARTLLFRKKRGLVSAAPVVTYNSGVYPAATAFGYSTAIHHPTSYATTAVHHPTAFATYSEVHHPTGYTAYAAGPAAVIPAGVTQVVHNNPGHAVSYRVY